MIMHVNLVQSQSQIPIDSLSYNLNNQFWRELFRS